MLKSLPSIHRLTATAMAVALAFFVVLPVPALTVAPARVEIKTIEDTVTLSVTHEGTPVPAADIGSVKPYVGNHDYDHMITVTKADGQIVIRPTPDLELSVYDLRIKTSHGDAVVEIISLQGIADAGLEARARRQGVSVEAIKAQLGISQPLGRETIELGLPQSYTVGQTLTATMKPAEGRTGIWRINGDVAPSDNGALKYTFEQTGVYDVAYIEKKGEQTIAVGLGTVLVVHEPPINMHTAVNADLSLAAPEGYKTVEWTVDGKDSVADAIWRGRFAEAGIHDVQVRLSSPSDESLQDLRVVTYRVFVK